MEKKQKKRLALLSLPLALMMSLSVALAGCNGTAGPAGPEGPKGEQGIQGEQGAPGKDGTNGTNGKDGLTPHIGSNGNWWIGEEDTHVFAGESVTPPTETLEKIEEKEVAATGKQKGFVKNGKYYTDFATLEEERAAAQELNIQVEAEGIVLLKNDNNALPLSKSARITLLGYTTQNITKGGGGSGSGRPGQYGVSSNTLQQELENAGLKVNPATINYYASNKKEVGELPAYVQATYKSYSDAAVVMFSRSGSENADIKAYGVDGDKHNLEFTDAEQALIRHAKKNFDKVIVLLNTGNIMEVGNINEKKTADNLGVDAVMWVGLTGNDGAAAIGRVLNGDINPSGKTADTWAADFTQDPTFRNFSDNGQNKGADGNPLDIKIYNEEGVAQKTSAELGQRSEYSSVEYREGIYVGYRYWETKGAIEGEDWYKQNVVYPFGYGLSYTTFKHELTSNVEKTGKITKANSTITLQVKVTNTGKVAGKDVVEAYYTAPYTNGGIEKAEVNLAAFAKTDLLQPGQSQIVTLQFVAQDMASFDWNDANENDFIGYELEKGDYKISVRSNAHDEVASFTRTIDNDIKCTTDYTTGAEIVSLFTGTVDGLERYKSTNDTLEENLMTRADGLQLPEACSKEDRTWSQDQIDELEAQITYYSYMDEESNPWYVSKVPTGWTQAADAVTGRTDGKTKIQLKDLFGKSYTEPTIKDGVATAATDADTQAWDAYLNQFTWEELATIVAYGGFGEVEVESVGKNASGAYDAAAHPFWNGAMFGQAQEPENQMGTNWCVPAVWGCTWNTDLMSEVGRMMGNEALFFNIEGLYGFSVNIHRSPFGGRNFEYISEDGLLAGKLAAAANEKITEKGLVTYTKHFMMNNQEYARNYAGGVLTWATEQAIREIYGRPYEHAVKEGGNSGFMTGFNRIGMQTCSTNWSLLEGLVRNEWGFCGDIVTDYLDYKEYRYTGLMVRTGNELPLGGADKKLNKGKAGVCSFPEGTWDAEKKAVLVAADETNALAAENARLADGIGADCSKFETVASATQWYNVRKSAQRILYDMVNGLGGLNGNAYKMAATVTLTLNEELTTPGGRQPQKYIDLNARVSAALESQIAEGSVITGVVCKSAKVEGEAAEGLTLNAANGQLSGTPTVAGSFTLNYVVYVDGWCYIPVTVTVTIAAATA